MSLPPSFGVPQRVPVPSVPAKPEGDPAAMLAMAHACRTAGRSLADAAGAAEGIVNAMRFTAPAASRVRGRVRGNRWGVEALGDDLVRFAAELERGAAELRAEIAAYRRACAARDAAIANNRRADALVPPKLRLP